MEGEYRRVERARHETTGPELRDTPVTLSLIDAPAFGRAARR